LSLDRGVLNLCALVALLFLLLDCRFWLRKALIAEALALGLAGDPVCANLRDLQLHLVVDGVVPNDLFVIFSYRF
jgi:hypothetical protein